MSFVLDASLVLILLVVAWVFAKRSIFSAFSGALAILVAVVASLFLTSFAASYVSQYAVAPLVERSAANELADMFSAPHLANGRDTVAQLTVNKLVYEEPEAYTQLLRYYNVSAEEVRAAYRADPGADAVLTALTTECIERFSVAVAFLVCTVVLYIVLRLIARRIEENFPPQRKYRGFRKILPCFAGFLSGLLWCWAAAQVLSLIFPAVEGMQMFFTPAVLAKTDLYALLTAWNPFAAM